MLKWLRGISKHPKRPSDFELGSQIASLIDAFIDRGELHEFSNDRLYIVITPDFETAIASRPFPKQAITAVPLQDLCLVPSIIAEGGMMRHMAVDVAAKYVITKLPP